jgi:hypothetical protein
MDGACRSRSPDIFCQSHGHRTPIIRAEDRPGSSALSVVFEIERPAVDGTNQRKHDAAGGGLRPWKWNTTRF